MVLPSGLHEGSRSAAPGVLVRLRVSPFSAGTVKISPCASNAARAPVGEMVRISNFVGLNVARCGCKVGQFAMNLNWHERGRRCLRYRAGGSSRTARRPGRRGRPALISDRSSCWAPPG